eukprot:14551226-Ditylum_brightwellii.AAC.1
MPTIEVVKTRHNKAATMTCCHYRQKHSTINLIRVMKEEMKHQRRVSTETATGITATVMAVAVMIMMLTGMVVTAHIPRLILEDTN